MDNTLSSMLAEMLSDDFVKSDFLSGLTTGGFRAGFDFVLQPDKFIRILEGQYDNRKSSANQGLLANDYDIDAIEKILLRNP